MTLLLTRDDVARVLTMADCMSVVEKAFGEGEGPIQRRRLRRRRSLGRRRSDYYVDAE